MVQILVVEDDVHIAELVTINLEDDQTSVKSCYNGNEGFLEASTNAYDLVILDLMLPGKKGLDICRELRASKVNTPILMLTSKSDEIDKILGLETGADDYMTKPFSVRELQARVKAIIRRQSFDTASTTSEEDPDLPVLTRKDLVVNQEMRKVELQGERLNLTPKEFELLCLLANNVGKTYSRAQLLHRIWGYEFEGYEHTVNSHINRLRAKIEQDPGNPEYILTTWGVGYRFSES
ncbi:response regulator, OmpR-family [Winogradskyella psychrotolerans RS-3]|uniref:Phosphate regulon transcriptional regulatory protein PhoB n=1 Tax=Winogradskyella psychrotolerans RS-3 TaxID=641526 RepID=S7VQ36_9FLAO|nr:response regulator transcription factor [Winogradskyella psychrotolerans]EPR72380.1 response regulator, OmpR-family [Winogradskyella psychrotolerans RS-3]